MAVFPEGQTKDAVSDKDSIVAKISDSSYFFCEIFKILKSI